MERFIKTSRRVRRVLVVDDEAINRELLEAILSLNYEVRTASDGKEAMEMLCAAKEPYSLILLDLLMPNKSGFQLLEECKSDERFRDIPVIVMTSEKSAEVRSIRMGADDFISKPYRMPEVIIARCERIIELSEEKKLIRSIERDKTTGLYIKVFFDAYVRRTAPDIRRPMDAVVLRLNVLQTSAEKDDLLRKAAELIMADPIEGSGLSCYMGDMTFCIFAQRRDDYTALTAQMAEQLSSSDNGGKVVLTAGIYEIRNNTEDPDGWFENAKSACDAAVDGTVQCFS